MFFQAKERGKKFVAIANILVLKRWDEKPIFGSEGTKEVKVEH